MPLDIIIDDNQSYSSGNNTTSFQDWGFNPEIPIEVLHIMQNAIPSDFDWNIQIKDFITSHGEDYTDFYVKYSFLNSGFSQQVVSLTGDIITDTDTSPNSGYHLTSANLNTTINVQFLNYVSLLGAAEYTVYIKLDVWGDNGTFLEIVESKIMALTIKVVNPQQLYIDPEQLTYNYTNGEALPAGQTISIYSLTDFYIKIKDCFTLTGIGIVNTNNVDGFNIYECSGEVDFTLSLNANVNNEDFGTTTYPMIIWNETNSQITGVTLNFYEELFLELDPGAFEFFAIKNYQEAGVIPFAFQCAGAFDIDYPSFVNNEDFSGNFGFTNNLGVVNSANLSPGIYLGNIVITFNGLDYLYPVKYTVAETVVLGLSEENINFTDDYNTISSFYGENTTRVLLNYQITLYSYRYGFPEEVLLNYKLSLFDNTVDEFIGKRIKNIMSEINSLSMINLETLQNVLAQDSTFFVRKLYKPVSLDLNIQLFNTSNSQIEEEFDYNSLLFLAGRKPKNSFNNSAILSFYRDPIRVTPNTSQLISFYKQQNHNLRLYKNGSFESQFVHTINEAYTFCMKLDFNNYQPGDLIELRLYKEPENEILDDAWFENSENYMSQKFVIFPEGKTSFHILYENESRTISSYEFTGSLTMGPDRTFTTSRAYNNFLEVIRKNRSQKTQTLKINTGPILKSNAKIIDEIDDAARAWLFIDKNSPGISLVPKTNKRIVSDTDQELYEYEVEFDINFNNDNEIHQ